MTKYLLRSLWHRLNGWPEDGRIKPPTGFPPKVYFLDGPLKGETRSMPGLYAAIRPESDFGIWDDGYMSDKQTEPQEDSVCDECGFKGDVDEHKCPIYYTYPRLTHRASMDEFVSALQVLQEKGYDIGSHWFPPDRLAMIVEIKLDLAKYGPAERHDRRIEKA